ncbi:3-dehydroquinate synthase [bacterium]
MSNIIPVSLKKDSYIIYAGLPYTELVNFVSQKTKGVLVVTDKNVKSLYYAKLEKAFIDAGCNVDVYVLEPGEMSKNLDVVNSIYTKCFELYSDRTFYIIALGGGVTGDIAGFAAATYLRGVPFIQVPTTLLAQVDASIGGKTGVNMPYGKNLIGSFYQPKAVWIDPGFLNTLDEKEYISGLAEVVKYAVIKDKSLFKYILDNSDALLKKEFNHVFYIIKKCAKIKAQIVEKDEKEKGLRRILNFGHTLGHALETSGEYKGLTHGEGVAVGMVFAAYLGYKLGKCRRIVEQNIEFVLKKLGFYIIDYYKNDYFHNNEDTLNRVIEIIRYDKKMEQDKINFIVPKKIGSAIAVKLDLSLIKKYLKDWGNNL